MTDKELKHESIGFGLDAPSSPVSFFKIFDIIEQLEEKVQKAHKHILRMKSENSNIISSVYKSLLNKTEWKNGE